MSSMRQHLRQHHEKMAEGFAKLAGVFKSAMESSEDGDELDTHELCKAAMGHLADMAEHNLTCCKSLDKSVVDELDKAMPLPEGLRVVHDDTPTQNRLVPRYGGPGVPHQAPSTFSEVMTKITTVPED